MTPTKSTPSAIAGEEKLTEPGAACCQRIVPFVAHRATTSPGPPVSLNVPTYTVSKKILGDDVIPLNTGLEIRVTFHRSAPLAASTEWSRPSEPPRTRVPLNTAGVERPRIAGFDQTMLPFDSSRAKRPSRVRMYTRP